MKMNGGQSVSAAKYEACPTLLDFWYYTSADKDVKINIEKHVYR